jgi:hypothetical protein
MTKPPARRPQWLLRAIVAVGVTCGLAGLALTALFGFEEPNDTLLLLSSAFLFAPVLAVFIHLSRTSALTPAQRRAWLRRLTSRRAAWAFGEYLSCDDLASAATRLGGDGTRKTSASSRLR